MGEVCVDVHISVLVRFHVVANHPEIFGDHVQQLVFIMPERLRLFTFLVYKVSHMVRDIEIFYELSGLLLMQFSLNLVCIFSLL